MTCRLLPEWSAQDAILLAWPHNGTDWKDNLPQIHAVYCQLISHITRFQRVVLIVANAEVQHDAEQQLKNAQASLDKIYFAESSYNDTWLRDTGPLTCAADGQLVMHDFRFNGWGGKFDARLDDKLVEALHARQIFSTTLQSHPVFLEGGSIDTDGAGTMLTTSTCLLTPTRNPSMSRDAYALMFKKTFDIDRIFWIDNGELLGDDTDSHIDMLARFCDPATIAYTACRDHNDVHFESLKKLEQELQGLRQINGESYTLVPLYIPAAQYAEDGERLPASYANFLIINNAVLVPTYNDAMDAAACKTLADCFPQREIIPVRANAIIQQGGSLHCLTMQLPAGSLRI